MSPAAKIAIGAVIAFFVLNLFLPWWVAALVTLGPPAAGYLMLDPLQRQRLRRVSRKQIGR